MPHTQKQASYEVPSAAQPQLASLDHATIQELAYQLWILRARPHGSPEVDWYRAEQELKNAIPSSKKVD